MALRPLRAKGGGPTALPTAPDMPGPVATRHLAGRVRRHGGFLIDVCAGLAAALGQAPWGLWPLSLLGLAVVVWRVGDAATGRRAFWRALAAGAGYFGLAMLWIIEPFLVEPEIYGWMAPFALVLMALGGALFWAIPSWAAWRLARGARDRALAVAAALALSDWIRGWLFTGLPWALTGHIWIDTPAGQDVILQADEYTTVPGQYSLTFDDGAGCARIGEITSFDPRDGTVQRAVEEVFSGDLTTATRGRFTGFVYPTPADAGLDAEDVQVPVPGGHARAWRIEPDPSEDGEPRPAEGLWAVMVHGRGARRNEGIRAVPTARRLGMTSLLISYRNDGDAPDAADARYGLGTTEWEDVEAAIRYALDHGARDVVLFGWSMGGAVVLQTVDRSALAPHVRGVVLTGPVIDWVDVLRHQARLNRIPEAVGLLGQWLLANRAGRFITGLAAPVDLKALDWVTRADHVRVPTLILHSEDDEYVPVGPSQDLAERNPDLVRFVRFHQARHTREQNVDPRKWDTAVRGWLRAVLSAPRPGDRRR